MKKFLSLLLAMAMCLGLLAGCGGSSTGGGDADSSEGATSASGSSSTEAEGDASEEGEDATGMSSVTSGISLAQHPEITTEGCSEDITVTISSNVDIAGIDAFAAAQSGRNDIRYLIYDQLAIMTTPGGEVEDMALQMAKSIEKIDDVTYQIEIYDYIHDWAGNAVTADDVVYSYTTMKDSGVSGKFSRLLESMEKVDDYTVIMHLAESSLGTAQYCLQYCPVVSQASYESQTEGERSQYPIGTGGYKIVDYVSGGYCYLERVDDYWQTDESLRSYAYSAQAKEIKIIVQTEAAQRTNSMLTGSSDVAVQISSTEISQFRNDDGTSKDGYNVLSYLSSTTPFVVFNCSEDSPLSNIDLRKAVCSAIDRTGVMDGTYGASGYLASVDLCNALVGDYNDDWTWYEYDAAAAESYLEASGLSDVTLTIMTDTSDSQKSIAVFIKEYLNMVGINVEIASYDAALITEYKNDSTMWDMRLDTPGSSDYATDAWNLMTSADTNEGRSYFMVTDETLDELVATATAIDTHSQDTVDAVHEYCYEQCYYLPLGTPYQYAVASDALLGWPLHPYNYLLYGGFIFE
ncbi:MAG: ABC transporter substrate-binding protein [Clostridiales bacterium]|nr:ABC transporter substrate-binding protein [Clostridiales bacterium]